MTSALHFLVLICVYEFANKRCACEQNGLDATVQIQRVAEGLEPHGFKSEFVMWTPPMSFGFNMASKPSTAAPEADIDVASLIAMKQAEETPVDDGSGKLEVWSVQLGGIMTPIDPTRYGGTSVANVACMSVV
jgi:hypothetical protein